MTFGYTGQLPPPRFNMARHCLDLSGPRTADKVGLVVVHDVAAGSDEAERWTYGELHDAVRAVAAGLLRTGLRPGDRIMLRLGNTSTYPLVFFGAVAAGMVPMPSSPQLTLEEAAFILHDSGASALAADGPVAHLPDGVRTVVPADVERWLASNDRAPFADTCADDVAYLMYTSGTTGRPKGVLHAHRAAWGRRPMYAGWLDIGPDDVMLHAGSFTWTYTLGVGVTDPWANGATAVIYNGPRDPRVWAELIEQHRATLFAAVPGVYRQLMRYTDVRRYDLSSLRHALVAGEALSPQVLQDWRDATGRELYEALGMSEISTFVSSSPSVPVRPGSAGRPQPGRCVAALPVDSAEGTDPVPTGQTGLLAVHRSDPGLMLGYWQRPDEEAELLRGDWFVGGDLVHVDEDGYVYYDGRNDDVMTAMGYRVSPREVEEALASHPTVAEVAVTQLRVRDGLHIVAAFVVPNDPDDPQALDAEVLLMHVHEHIAGYKCPREIIFVDALPRTPNGKLRRRELATRFER